MKISARNGFAIVEHARINLFSMRPQSYRGTNTAVIKNIRSTECNSVLQSLKFKVVVRANYYRANLFRRQTKNLSAPILSSIMHMVDKDCEEIWCIK